MKNLEKLISRTAECRRVFAGKRDLDYVAVTYSEALLIKAEVDARIAELTDEVAEVRELNRKLGINNDRLRSELLAISFIAGDSNATIEAIKDIARNALKEGV